MSISKIKEKLPARHKYYVSMANGCIYRAMNTPGEEGYEDRHPAEWRPATEAEVERYLKGDDNGEAGQPEFETVDVGRMLNADAAAALDEHGYVQGQNIGNAQHNGYGAQADQRQFVQPNQARTADFDGRDESDPGMQREAQYAGALRDADGQNIRDNNPPPIVASTSAPTTPQSAPAPAISPLAPAVAPTQDSAFGAPPALAAPVSHTPVPVAPSVDSGSTVSPQTVTQHQPTPEAQSPISNPSTPATPAPAPAVEQAQAPKPAARRTTASKQQGE